MSPEMALQTDFQGKAGHLANDNMAVDGARVRLVVETDRKTARSLLHRARVTGEPLPNVVGKAVRAGLRRSWWRRWL